jgi:hypothetical protein
VITKFPVTYLTQKIFGDSQIVTCGHTWRGARLKLLTKAPNKIRQMRYIQKLKFHVSLILVENQDKSHIGGLYLNGKILKCIDMNFKLRIILN